MKSSSRMDAVDPHSMLAFTALVAVATSPSALGTPVSLKDEEHANAGQPFEPEQWPLFMPEQTLLMPYMGNGFL